ncbi:hypothetical protein [Morganella morganii IS15]|nr:hypothetical protein [Morganella morganii IS15]
MRIVRPNSNKKFRTLPLFLLCAMTRPFASIATTQPLHALNCDEINSQLTKSSLVTGQFLKESSCPNNKLVLSVWPLWAVTSH